MELLKLLVSKVSDYLISKLFLMIFSFICLKDFDTIPYGIFVPQMISNPVAAINYSRILIFNSEILTKGYITAIELYGISTGIITIYVRN